MPDRDYKIDIDTALDRAMLCADMSMFGKKIDGNTFAEPVQPRRQIRADLAIGYAEIARALQEERRWEAEQIERIAKGGFG